MRMWALLVAPEASYIWGVCEHFEQVIQYTLRDPSEEGVKRVYELEAMDNFKEAVIYGHSGVVTHMNS